jgi:hypothetical protein
MMQSSTNATVDWEFPLETGQSGNGSFNDTSGNSRRKKCTMHGCLDGKTMIKMADGSSQRIRKVSIGDAIMGVDSQIWTVSNTWIGREDIMVCVETKLGMLKLTKNHPLMTKEGIKNAKGLSTGEYLLSGEGEYLKIIALYEEFYSDMVYNLDLKSEVDCDPLHHLMIAGGLVVGDNILQNHMEKMVWVRQLMEHKSRKYQ